MKTVAIVAEYNPFHMGHLYQIEKIREEWGEDARIVAIMSGNMTQRGELALADKVLRAKCAVLCGVNLVLELPFPYSMASAEHFARAAVSIADSLGVIDILSFGSECGEISTLQLVRERISGEAFSTLRDEIMTKDPTLGYPKACELAYKSLYVDEEFHFSPNNILALMYIDALSISGSKITPHTIKRVGSGYCDPALSSSYPSATAIRTGLCQGKDDVLKFVPTNAQAVLDAAYQGGNMLLSSERLYSAVISKLLLNSPNPESVYEGEDGLYNRLAKNASKATSLSDLITLSETKKYTRARIRRVIFNALVGVTSSDIRKNPTYTQLLASDASGLAILKKAKKTATIPILTKPSRTADFPPEVQAQLNRSRQLDVYYYLALGKGHCASDALTFTPFVKPNDSDSVNPAEDENS